MERKEGSNKQNITLHHKMEMKKIKLRKHFSQPHSGIIEKETRSTRISENETGSGKGRTSVHLSWPWQNTDLHWDLHQKCSMQVPPKKSSVGKGTTPIYIGGESVFVCVCN